MKRINLKKDIIISIIVLILSILNIINNQLNIISLSVGLSIIGILGIVSYFLKLKYFKYLIIVWFFFQLPNIEFGEMINGVKEITNSFNLNQTIDLRLGLSFGSTTSIYIGLNIVPIVFIGLYKLLLSNSLIGEMVTITPVREISALKAFSPLEIEIIDTLKGEFVGTLNSPITIGNKTFYEIYFRTEDKSIFKLNKERQICNIRLKNENKVIETNGYMK